MVRERPLKAREFKVYLECYCHSPGFPIIKRAGETRFGGTGCTCTKYVSGKRSRPFRVGGATIVAKPRS